MNNPSLPYGASPQFTLCLKPSIFTPPPLNPSSWLSSLCKHNDWAPACSVSLPETMHTNWRQCWGMYSWSFYLDYSRSTMLNWWRRGAQAKEDSTAKLLIALADFHASPRRLSFLVAFCAHTEQTLSYLSCCLKQRFGSLSRQLPFNYS